MDKIILPLDNTICKIWCTKDTDCVVDKCGVFATHDADQAILDKAVVESYEAGKAEAEKEKADYGLSTFEAGYTQGEADGRAAKTPTVEQIIQILDETLTITMYEQIQGRALAASAILALFKGE
jgi:hypothetical protein